MRAVTRAHILRGGQTEANPQGRGWPLLWAGKAVQWPLDLWGEETGRYVTHPTPARTGSGKALRAIRRNGAGSLALMGELCYGTDLPRGDSMETRIATAEWADPGLVEEKYLFRKGDVWLGRSAGRGQLPIGYSDDRHVCLASGSRGGKGTSLVVNNLCLWPGSVVVVDPKGENATITVPRRGNGSPECLGLRQKVYVLDPFKSAQVDDAYRSRFNPLDALSPDNEESIDEAGRIADALVVIHESNDPFWDESARSMVKGLILHVLTAPEYEGRRNLITVRQLITRGDWEAVEALRNAGEKEIPPGQGLLWTRVADNQAFGGIVAGIGDTFANMMLNAPKQFESVLQVANRNSEFVDSPAMQRCLGASDFKLSELKTRPEGMSLYLCLPQRFMNTHYRWLRMMIALTVTEMEIVRGKPATGFPVLMMLDEFAGLKRMEIIENAVAQIAGYGVKLFFVLQSLEQLKAVYKDNWETFLSNSGLKVFFSLDDHFSRDYVSKLVGDTELVREVRSGSESESESESRSHSTGTSASRSSSVSDGTNRSTSDSQSRGTNNSFTRTRGRTGSDSWTEHGIFHLPRDTGHSQSRNRSKSWTEGTSQGSSRSQSAGTSHGTSESYGSTTSETDGTTVGTSRSRTMGTSETIHRRRLVSPDEIGHLFARIDDPEEGTYPGLALIVISGERTIALRRVNYYEDLEFIGRFQPHPDHGAAPPVKELSFNGKALDELTGFFKEMGLSAVFREWLVKERQLVSAGEPVVELGFNQTTGVTTSITAPRDGMIMALPGKQWNGAIEAGPIFSMRYFDNGEAPQNPLQHLPEFYARYERSAETFIRQCTTYAVIWGACVVAASFGVLAEGFLKAAALLAGFICAIQARRYYSKRKVWSNVLIRFRKKLLAKSA